MDAIPRRQTPGDSSGRRGISWQILTFINIAIALVTITVAAVNRTGFKTEKADPEHRKGSEFSAARPHHADHGTETAIFDVADMRVDDFGTIPPAAFYEVLLRASPAELTNLALRFNNLPNNTRTGAAVGMFFQAWAELDGKSALAGAFQIRDIGLRRMAANTVVHSASPSVAAELAGFLITYPDKDLKDETNRYLNATISRWADVDPAAAAQFMESIADTEFAKQFSADSNIAFSWGTLDPKAALDWVDKQKTETPEMLFNNVVTGWAKNDPAAAGAYVIQHFDHAGADDAALSIATAMLEYDPAGATNWLRQMPPGESRLNAERNFAAVWAEKDPLSAARWAETLEKESQSVVANTIASIWSAQDWSETRKWLGTISGDFRDSAVGGALTSDYQNRVPPAESLPLALSMMDKQSRNAVVQHIIQRWATDEPQAAANWIQNSVLSHEEKQGLLSLDVFSQERYQP